MSDSLGIQGGGISSAVQSSPDQDASGSGIFSGVMNKMMHMLEDMAELKMMEEMLGSMMGGGQNSDPSAMDPSSQMSSPYQTAPTSSQSMDDPSMLAALGQSTNPSSGMNSPMQSMYPSSGQNGGNALSQMEELSQMAQLLQQMRGQAA